MLDDEREWPFLEHKLERDRSLGDVDDVDLKVVGSPAAVRDRSVTSKLVRIELEKET